MKNVVSWDFPTIAVLHMFCCKL